MQKGHKFTKIIVDGSAYLYRAYHASAKANLHSTTGIPTGAIHVMLNMLMALLKEYNQATIVVVFDAPGKNFRHEIYPEYKANRSTMPDELRTQVPYIKQIIEALGMPLLSLAGLEADDVIGTFAKQADEAQEPLLICTGDKDFAQLVSDNVFLLDTMKDLFLDSQAVIKKFGLPPELIIDYLALMGDKSDNIPGAPGVGDKTATILLQQLGSIDNILQYPEKILELKIRGNKSLVSKITENIEIIQLSKKLATIKTDIDMEYNLSTMTMQDKDLAAIKKLYKQLEIKHLLSFIDQQEIEKNKQSVNYYAITTKKALLNLIAEIKQTKLFAIDTETTSLNINDAKLVGISIATKEYEAAYIPLAHTEKSPQLDLNWVLEQLQPILEDASFSIVMQNAKYDINILYKYGITAINSLYDTMLESYVLNSTLTRHNMDAMAMKYLDHKTISYEDITGRGKQQLTFDAVAIEQATTYAAEDADITLRLHNKLWSQLAKNANLKAIFLDIEMPLMKILAIMERTGLMIDSAILQQQTKELTSSLHQLEQDIFDKVDQTFNILSTKQLQEILFDKLQLPVIKKTATGKPSTSEDVLQELALEFDVPQKIISYRSLYKLKTAYTEKLPLMVHAKTKRLHTTYHQAVTSTGRLSSADPNIQNIPIKTPQGRLIRNAFIVPQNAKIIAADYSQVELRIMAHLSADVGLIDAFKHNLDVHKITASEIFAVSVAEVTEEQRRKAKTINFGLIYGMSAFGLSKQIDVSLYSAKQYVEAYFAKYPGVKQYMEASKEFAREHGYVETIYGRRLYLPQINSQNAILRNAAERLAINAPLQGSAADIIKKAMLRIYHAINEHKYKAKMIMQVHDELVFEVNNADVTAMKAEINKQMIAEEKLNVPLVVDIGIGANWGVAH